MVIFEKNKLTFIFSEKNKMFLIACEKKKILTLKPWILNGRPLNNLTGLEKSFFCRQNKDLYLNVNNALMIGVC